MKLRTMAVAGVGAICGLGLIGVGAHATFTATANVHQQVSSGTTGIILHSTDAAAAGNTTPNLTLVSITTQGSSFYTREHMTIINNGSNTITHFGVTGSAVATNTLAKNVWACVTLRGTDTVLYNGYANVAHWTMDTQHLGSGDAIQLTIRLFAGVHSFTCGVTPTSLPPGAMGQTTQFTLHIVGTT